MSTGLEITCIVKRDRTNPHERIQEVGGAGFHFSQAQAVQMTKAQPGTFWTRGGGKVSEVIVQTSAAGHDDLRTRSDGVVEDNLLHLPICR